MVSRQQGGSTQTTQSNPPVSLVPRGVVAVSVLWLALLVAVFVCWHRIDAFADFVTFDLGRMPFSSIWFGAVGGWLISAKGIFDHNRNWNPSYDYWHYIRPILGAVIGTLGCLTFVVLDDAATRNRAVVSTPLFLT
jgi:hypothetical protein